MPGADRTAASTRAETLRADAALYRAKDNGRNQVVCDGTPPRV